MTELLRVTADARGIDADLAGRPVVVPVRVFNVSSIVDGYRIDAPHAPPWLRVDPVEVRLLPGTDEVAEVRFVVTRPDGVPARDVTVDLRIQSVADRGVARTVPIVVSVPTIEADIAVTMEPALLRGERAGARVVVRNQAGNVGAHLRLQGSDQEGVVQFAFEPPVVTVAPGQSAVAAVQVAAPKPRDRPVRRQLRIVADDGQRQFVTEGVLEQQPPEAREPFDPKPLLRVVLTILGAFLIFVGTFRPWVGSLSGADLTVDRACDIVALPFGLDCGLIPPISDLVPGLLISAGIVTVVLAVAAGIGVIGTGALTRFAGVVTILYVLLVVFVLSLAVGAIAPGSGVLTVVAGGIAAVIGGVLARR